MHITLLRAAFAGGLAACSIVTGCKGNTSAGPTSAAGTPDNEGHTSQRSESIIYSCTREGVHEAWVRGNAPYVFDCKERVKIPDEATLVSLHRTLVAEDLIRADDEKDTHLVE